MGPGESCPRHPAPIAGPADGMAIEIRLAASDADYSAFASLVGEYVDWCRARYRDDPDFVDRILGHQSLARELQSLRAVFGPPNGRAFIARRGGEACGCGAWRDLGDGICEMKRLFVPERFRGHGVGRKLSDALTGSARASGFRLMRLDTLSEMTEAIALYEAIGFRRCAPYNLYPEDLKSRVVFLELSLTAGPRR